MRYLLLVSVLLLGTGCAAVDMEDHADLSGITNFTSADLQAALEQATAQEDLAGVHCWTTLLAVVKSGPVKLPEIKGVASAIQARRGVTNNSGLNSLKTKIHVWCSALFVSEAVTLGRLFGRATGMP